MTKSMPLLAGLFFGSVVALLVATRTADVVVSRCFENVPELVVLDSLRQDVGNVLPGETIEVTFRVKNIGQKRLVIQRETCSCTRNDKAESFVIPSGQVEELSASFDTPIEAGSVSRKIHFTTNDDSHPSLALDVTATVVGLN